MGQSLAPSPENNRGMRDSATRRGLLKASGGLAGVAGLGGLSGCLTLALQVGGNPVRVSSKRFTEQEILGYMAYEILSNETDVNVEDQIGLGGTTTNFEALRTGQVQIYWEYSGTAWLTLPPTHEEIIPDPQKIYRKAAQEMRRAHDLVYLDRAPLNNTYVLLANPDWVEKTGVKTLSGFAKYMKQGNTDFTVVMNAEFQSRADGWPGVAKHYGFGDLKSQLNIRNIGSGLLYQVLGTGQAEVGVGFNTDPRILQFDLRVLEDNESFFVPYNPAPLVNGDALKQHPSIEAPLNKASRDLTTDRIRELNRRVSLQRENPQVVARDSLQKRGLI